MILTSMKSTYLLGASFVFCTLVIVGCWNNDDRETPSIETTHAEEAVMAEEPLSTNQAAHSGKTAPSDGVAPTNQAVRSSGAASAGEHAPTHGTEIDDSVDVSARSDSPAPLRLKIFDASAIVRASLVSSSAGAVRYSEALGLDLDGEPLTSFDVVFNKLGPGGWPVDGEYRAAHIFRFRVEAERL